MTNIVENIEEDMKEIKELLKVFLVEVEEREKMKSNNKRESEIEEEMKKVEIIEKKIKENKKKMKEMDKLLTDIVSHIE